MKGAAATIGADAVCAAAATLETVCEQNGGDEEINAALQKLELELNSVINSLNSHFEHSVT